VRGRESAVNAYVITGKEMNFLAAYFHPKLKKPTTGQSKNSYPPIPVEV
jgi:hypothetical protein